MVVADVLHEARWTAPWDDAPSPTPPGIKASGPIGDLKMREAKAAAIAVICLTAGAIGMGAAAGLADVSLSAAKSSHDMVAAARPALNWDGGHAALVWR